MTVLNDLLARMRERAEATAPTLSERRVFDEPCGVIIVPAGMVGAAKGIVGAFWSRVHDSLEKTLPAPTTYRNKRRRGQFRRQNRQLRRQLRRQLHDRLFTIDGEEQ